MPALTQKAQLRGTQKSAAVRAEEADEFYELVAPISLIVSGRITGPYAMAEIVEMPKKGDIEPRTPYKRPLEGIHKLRKLWPAESGRTRRPMTRSAPKNRKTAEKIVFGGFLVFGPGPLNPKPPNS